MTLSAKFDNTFIRQWQATLSIINGTGFAVFIVWDLMVLATNNTDWTLPIVATLSVALVTANVIKGYLIEFVNFQKL